MMKRFALAAVVALALLSLTACSGGKNEESTTTETATQSETVATDSTTAAPDSATEASTESTTTETATQ